MMLDDIEQLRIEKELKQQEGYGMKDFYNQKFSRVSVIIFFNYFVELKQLKMNAIQIIIFSIINIEK